MLFRSLLLVAPALAVPSPKVVAVPPKSASTAVPGEFVLRGGAQSGVDALFGSLDTLVSTALSAAGPIGPILSGVLNPTAVAEFLTDQRDQADARRAVQKSEAVSATAAFCTGVFQPLRCAQITLASGILVQVMAAVSKKDGWDNVCNTVSTISGVVTNPQKTQKQICNWLDMGRSKKGGLFRCDTWKGQKSVVLKAWNKQFSTQQQQWIGMATGWILAPLLWTATTVVGKGALVAVAVSELYGLVSKEGKKKKKNSVTLPDPLDSTLRAIRSQFRITLTAPVAALESGAKGLNKVVPQEKVPVAVQQGAAIGVVLGLMAAI